MMIRNAIAAALLLGAATTAQAQSTSRGPFLNAHLNGTAIKAEDAERERGGGIGFGGGYGFSERIALFLNLDAAAMTGENDEEYTLGHLDLGLRYTFGTSTAKWRPSLDASVGVRVLQADLSDPDFGPGNVEMEMSGGVFSVGGGVGYFFSPVLALDMGLRVSMGKFSTVKFDNVTIDLDDEDKVSATSSRFNIGLSWYPTGNRTAP